MLSSKSIITKKENGKILSFDEIDYIVNRYTSNKISDNIMGSWLKAVYNKGMDYNETLDYTKIMLNSGIKLDYSYLDGYVIDKHSTGGVGDKVSIVLAPILAACGCYVPMIAGRSLEHTGGTIDKLETIPGYQTSLSIEKFTKIVESVGLSIMSQTKQICPSDKKIYSLRDMTNTVASLPLICGSIMSKKIAEGIKGLVLDIKVGNGAFMKTLNDAKELGVLLNEVGHLYGLNMSICYTNMNQPLGNSAGLWCEIVESIKCLKGDGPNDLMEVVFLLGKKALDMAGIDDARNKMNKVIQNGYALNKFQEMVKSHGGDVTCIDDYKTHNPKYCEKIYSNQDGFIYDINTLEIGKALNELGGSYASNINKLDPTVGMYFFKKIGDSVESGEAVMEIFCSNLNKITHVKSYIANSISITDNIKIDNQLIYK